MTPPTDGLAGQNARPLADTVAETGPGIPDDAVLDGELGPGELGGRAADAEVEALVRSGWAPPTKRASPEPLDLTQAEAEVEAHPSLIGGAYFEGCSRMAHILARIWEYHLSQTAWKVAAQGERSWMRRSTSTRPRPVSTI